MVILHLAGWWFQVLQPFICWSRNSFFMFSWSRCHQKLSEWTRLFLTLHPLLTHVSLSFNGKRNEQRRQVRQRHADKWILTKCKDHFWRVKGRIRDSYLKCSLAEAKPMREVKEGIWIVFQGEGGVSPHRFNLYQVCPAFQCFSQVDLP